MLASVLRSERAVAVSIEIIRAFVRMRRLLAEDAALARRVAALERDSASHDAKIRVVFEALRTLSPDAPTPSRRKVGFRAPAGSASRPRRAPARP